jgi:branched-subunit amino acid ABC-type transport system permease component
MVVPGLFLGASVALVTFDPLVLFSFHPTAMALGYGALMTPGAFLALKRRGAPGPALRVAGLWAHAALQTAASAACFGGLVAIVANKTIKRKPHLVSLHATLGAASLLLACARSPPARARSERWASGTASRTASSRSRSARTGTSVSPPGSRGRPPR